MITYVGFLLAIISLQSVAVYSCYLNLELIYFEVTTPNDLTYINCTNWVIISGLYSINRYWIDCIYSWIYLILERISLCFGWLFSGSKFTTYVWSRAIGFNRAANILKLGDPTGYFTFYTKHGTFMPI